MATTTATIFIGQAHQNDSGIIPTHLIQFTENDMPGIKLINLSTLKSIKFIPSHDRPVDDIFLIISIYGLGGISITKQLESNCISEVFEKNELKELYDLSKNILETQRIKTVFNLLDNSILLSHIEDIKQYPNDFEITTPAYKKEYDRWSNKLVIKDFNK
jgi:hypothetical protein